MLLNYKKKADVDLCILSMLYLVEEKCVLIFVSLLLISLLAQPLLQQHSAVLHSTQQLDTKTVHVPLLIVFI